MEGHVSPARSGYATGIAGGSWPVILAFFNTLLAIETGL